MTPTPNHLGEFLRPDHVVVPLEVESVRSAIKVLVERLESAGAVHYPERLTKLTSQDRVRDVVHIGTRVLMSHLRTDAVDGPTVALGVSPSPVSSPFGAGQGTENVVVLVLAPPDASSLYVQIIAALTRLLRRDSVVDRLVSLQTPEDLDGIPELRDFVLQPRVAVRDVMTQRVYRVFPDTPLPELIELMTRHNLKAVPVVGEKREVLGMVTERDLLKHLQPRIARFGTGQAGEEGEQAASGALVRDIMSRSVMCVSEDQSIADAVSTMLNKDVERFPVVSEGRLSGLLTRGDILRRMFGT